MNLEKLDQKTVLMIVLTCTAIVLGVLVIDMQIAKNLAMRAQEIDDFIRRNDGWTDPFGRQSEVPRSTGTVSRPSFDRDHGGDPVERNSGVETGKDSPDSEIPMEGWDVFPIDRSAVNGARRIGNLEVPEKRGKVQ